MKRMMNKLSVAIVAMMMVTAAPAIASGNKNTKASNNNQALHYLGNIESNPVFELKLQNEQDEAFNVNIVGAKDHVLYNEIVRGKNIARRYMLDVDSEDLKNIRFEVINKKTGESKVFQVENNSYVVNNVSITSL